MTPLKLLIYADSRGQHTPHGESPYEIFTTRLANRPDVDATVFLCPMKWTTTIDFLDILEKYPPEGFDHVLLHTGIVEWSPRPQPSAINDLYNNQHPVNLDNLSLNTREYARKVINNKKSSFDKIFTEEAMQAHLVSDLGVEYEGHPTVNMYSLEMAKQKLLPKLTKIDNLIFINSNKFVQSWEGDFKRGRPKNIALAEKYSALFRDVLGPEKVIDLLEWDEADIKRYTCDNIHFTRAGSEFLYEKVVQRLKLDAASVIGARPNESGDLTVSSETAPPFAPFGRPILTPSPLSVEDRGGKLRAAGLGPQDKLATLIVGARFPNEDESRATNLRFLLSWIDRFYGDLFDVLIVEQDSVSRIDRLGPVKPYVRHEFLYNPKTYNRGWGYNVAVKHFTKSSVVVLMDTDVLTGDNFVDEIVACHKQYIAVSPYTNIYFTNRDESAKVTQSHSLAHLRRCDGVTKPTTISGGILIIRRAAFLDVSGFEQYTGYGGEDRALDVTLANSCAESQIHLAPFVYPHLHHGVKPFDKDHLDQVLTHLRNHYGCSVDMTLGAGNGIHKNCKHVSQEKTEANIDARAATFADMNLYRRGRRLNINGTEKVVTQEEISPSLVFPPDFKNLKDYPASELYNAPEPDTDELARLYNLFKGERCFIIGNGPSLNKHDLSLLKDEYVFAVNSFFYKTDETGFCPTFYVVEDTSVMKENIDRIRAYEAPYKFFPTNYCNLHPKMPNVYFFRMNRGFYEKSSPNYCIPRFSTDASKVLYCGQSVTYLNLQLAFFMGFTEAYLIGMDFDYVIPKEHGRRGDIIISTTDDPNHFHKDYFGKGKTWKDPKLDRVGLNYRQAKLSYEAAGRKIYNATIGGKLEIFERVEYEVLLRDPTTGKRRAERAVPVIVSSGQDAVPANPSPPQRAISSTSEIAKGHARAPRGSACDGHTIRQRLASSYARIALVVRTKAPLLFRLAQMSVWVLRAVGRHKPAAMGGLVALAATCTLPFYLTPVWAWRYEIWCAAAACAALAVTAVVIREALRRLAAANAAATANAARSARKAAERGIVTLERRIAARDSKLRQLVERVERDTKQISEVLRAEADRGISAATDALRAELAKDKDVLTQACASIEREVAQGAATTDALRKELAKDKVDVALLRERIAASERQVGAIRYPDAPSTFVFFGHHKCASRFFRLEVFTTIAEATAARVRRYEIQKPPFHYSKMDELDLCNLDFEGLGQNGRDVVWFANASARSLAKIRDATKSWKGLRVIRDPRQVLISNYFHHKGGHPDVSPLGWVWDQLVKDRPLLRVLPMEEGLLHELDNITRQVIEEQILARFDDPCVMTIRVEDFDADPKGWLQKISEFLEVPDIAGIDFRNTQANPESGPWQNHFTSRLRNVFKERYGQALIELGYEKDLDW